MKQNAPKNKRTMKQMQRYDRDPETGGVRRQTKKMEIGSKPVRQAKKFEAEMKRKFK